VAYGSGIIIVGLVLVSVSFTLALSEIATALDPQVAKTFFVYEWNSAAIQSAPLAALVAASAVLGFRYGALPTWLTWFSVPIVILMLAIGVSGPGMATGIGYAWVALFSLVLAFQAWQGRELPSGNTV